MPLHENAIHTPVSPSPGEEAAGKMLHTFERELSVAARPRTYLNLPEKCCTHLSVVPP